MVKTNISVWLSTNHLDYQDLVNKEVFYSIDGLWKVKPKYYFEPILHPWLFSIVYHPAEASGYPFYY